MTAHSKPIIKAEKHKKNLVRVTVTRGDTVFNATAVIGDKAGIAQACALLHDFLAGVTTAELIMAAEGVK